jgi:hypothetical protein
MRAAKTESKKLFDALGIIAGRARAAGFLADAFKFKIAQMKKLAVLLVLFVGASISSAPAQSLDFDFTITSQYYYDYGNTYSYTTPESYTLTGEIIGLQNNASSAPADILIFNTIFPDGGGLQGFDQNPYSLKAHDFTEVGTFTVSDGAIIGTSSGGVSYNFSSQTQLQDFNGAIYDDDGWDNFYFNAVSEADGTDGVSGITNVNGQNGGSGLFYTDAAYYAGEEAYNTNGLTGATYTLVATPEPATWALLLGGLGLLAFMPRRALRA